MADSGTFIYRKKSKRGKNLKGEKGSLERWNWFCRRRLFFMWLRGKEMGANTSQGDWNLVEWKTEWWCSCPANCFLFINCVQSYTWILIRCESFMNFRFLSPFLEFGKVFVLKMKESSTTILNFVLLSKNKEFFFFLKKKVWFLKMLTNK